MSTYTDGPRFSADAGADLSAKRYYIVKTDANGKVVLASAATDKLIGVLDNTPEANDTADVVLRNGQGTFKVIAGGTISKDAYLTTDASGKAVATTTSGNHVFGQAVRAAVAGDIVEYFKKDFIHA